MLVDAFGDWLAVVCLGEALGSELGFAELGAVCEPASGGGVSESQRTREKRKERAVCEKGVRVCSQHSGDHAFEVVAPGNQHRRLDFPRSGYGGRILGKSWLSRHNADQDAKA